MKYGDFICEVLFHQLNCNTYKVVLIFLFLLETTGTQSEARHRSGKGHFYDEYFTPLKTKTPVGRDQEWWTQWTRLKN